MKDKPFQSYNLTTTYNISMSLNSLKISLLRVQLCYPSLFLLPHNLEDLRSIDIEIVKKGDFPFAGPTKNKNKKYKKNKKKKQEFPEQMKSTCFEKGDLLISLRALAALSNDSALNSCLETSTSGWESEPEVPVEEAPGGAEVEGAEEENGEKRKRESAYEGLVAVA